VPIREVTSLLDQIVSDHMRVACGERNRIEFGHNVLAKATTALMGRARHCAGPLKLDSHKMVALWGEGNGQVLANVHSRLKMNKIHFDLDFFSEPRLRKHRTN
jgi:hypothetical protein